MTPPTYRVMEVAGPGMLTLATRETAAPPAGEALICVEACGMCGADIGDIERRDLAPQPPRVPGHEVIGRIVSLGARVSSRWTVGQRVGVGRLGGHCNECEQCRRGQFQLCLQQPIVGSTCDGGYAEMMLARQTGLVAIPDELRSEEAAPILCAGVATFNALKKCGAEPGDMVAVHGIGGLGHMALQYARRMGFRVVAVGRGQAIAADAVALGAHAYVDSERDDPGAVLRQMGSAHAIVTTVSDPEAIAGLVVGLAPHGRLVLLASGKNRSGSQPVRTGDISHRVNHWPRVTRFTAVHPSPPDSPPVVETICRRARHPRGSRQAAANRTNTTRCCARRGIPVALRKGRRPRSAGRP